MTKTEINHIVQTRYDKLMQIGKHGHYETMFKVVHEMIAVEREECARICKSMPNPGYYGYGADGEEFADYILAMSQP